MITIPKFRTASKQNIRTFALPFESQPYTFKMSFEYDSWNRIQTMTYPDGEVVSYDYNRGGMLNKVFGSVTRNLWEMIEPIQVQGGLTEPDGVMGGGIAVPIDPPVGPIEPQTITYRYPYIDSIIYNVFELKDSVIYGNGTRVSYEYDSLQRLSHLRSYTASGTKMQDITYTYDSASNITHISNSAGSVSGLGGRYEGHYTYDNLYRLVAANGYWKNSRDSLPFNESMNYTANGRILRKTVNAEILNGNHSTTKSSDFRYSYASHSNKIANITDVALLVATHSFQWDGCGNVERWAMLSKTGTQWIRTHTWTEDNRLQTVADNSWFSYYQYDAGGERTYKLTWAGSSSNRSGDRSIYYTPDEATLYASPYIVITPQGYTKHYYAEAERITSQLGKGQFADVGTPVVIDSLVQVKLQAVTGNVEFPATLTVPGSGVFAYLDTLTNQQNATSTLYFYHPDHLGSSSWITTTNGTVKQHLHYLPWGETYVDQKSNRFDGVRYTFSAKEKDSETGYSYFGSRYYNSDLSIWLSVDPMSDKYPSMSPYVYCANNPVKLVDPNGEEVINGYAQELDQANCTVNELAEKLHGLERGTKEYRNTKHELHQAQRILDKIQDKYNIVENVINDYRGQCPEEFDRIDHLEGPSGAEVDVVVTLKYNLNNNTRKGQSDIRYIESNGDFGRTSFTIYLFHNVKMILNPKACRNWNDFVATFAHECGHIFYEVFNPAEYKQWLIDNGHFNEVGYDGHKDNSPSGIEANKWEDKYRGR